MKRCWDIAIERWPRPQLRPTIHDVYHSAQVRGESASPDYHGNERKGQPAVYKGIQMRSKLEADYARALDRIGASWEYEPGPFLGTEGGWLPDFLVNGVWTELKPSDFTATEIAGQIRRISVIWETDPEAVVRVQPWRYGVGAALVITGRDGIWSNVHVRELGMNIR